MPNWCFTNYVIAGDEKEISDLHEKLSSLPSRDDVHENGFGKFWLGNVVGLFGGNWEQINCRGSLYDLEKRSPTEISFGTETAWGDMPEVWDFVLKQYPGLKYYFYAEECGNCYYATNDQEGKYFPDRFIVDKYVNGSTGYTTKDEAMKNVSAHIAQPIESWTDMLSKIEKFNADNVDNEIYIHEIQVSTKKITN